MFKSYLKIETSKYLILSFHFVIQRFTFSIVAVIITEPDKSLKANEISLYPFLRLHRCIEEIFMQ